VKAMVVYESLMGDTRQIAEAIAHGLREALPQAAVRCNPAGETQVADAELDLIVVGAPTHFLGLPSARSRWWWIQQIRSSAGHAALDAALEHGADGPGMREWLGTLPKAPRGAVAASFDTRLDRLVTGSAARTIARRLRRKGYRLLAPPAGFFVTEVAGPLVDGEAARARAWGRRLGHQLGSGLGPTAPTASPVDQNL
jgi:hypothetical protein